MNNLINLDELAFDEADFWNSCVFVFDSSALLNLYEYSKIALDSIFANIFDKIPDRLWVPNRVYNEFYKNRISALEKPLTKYDGLKTEVENLKNTFDRLVNLTKNQDKHPIIDHSKFQSIQNDLENFINKLYIEIDERKADIKAIKDNDEILNKFKQSFRSGIEFEYEKIIDIVKEGEIRYRNEIPPGYMDFKEKIGFDKFGDLILWKQIIDFAKATHKNILFVNNDIKEDWWIKNKNKKEVQSPRYELELEIKSEANVNFVMYTMPDFLRKSEEYLKTKFDVNVIKEAQVIMENMKVLKLRSHEFVDCRHPELKYTVSISWNHSTQTLSLSPITNPEIVVPDNLSASLESYKYILLNPDHEDYQWKLHVFVNDLSKKVEIEIITRPRLGNSDFILVDNQK